jgi:pimeloyl-ACP methyl ester carboxylesterase
MTSRTDDADRATPAVSITLLHGVGLAPSLFDELIDVFRDALVDELSDSTATVVQAAIRRGYDDGSLPAATFDDLLADVAAIVDRAAPTLLVGVSGGATLALAAALSAMPGVVGVVAHEPLVGPLAAELHALVSTSAATLAASSEPAAALAFVERLVGADTWSRLPTDARDFTERHLDVVRAEVPLFLAFEPTVEQLASSAVPIVVTTGGTSASARHAAAAVLERLAGATVRTVDDAGHLAHWEQPSAFASIVRSIIRSALDSANDPAPDARRERTP